MILVLTFAKIEVLSGKYSSSYFQNWWTISTSAKYNDTNSLKQTNRFYLKKFKYYSFLFTVRKNEFVEMKIFAFLIPVFLSQEHSSYFNSVSLPLEVPEQPECNSNQRSICQKRGFQCFGKWNRRDGEIFECITKVILIIKNFLIFLLQPKLRTLLNTWNWISICGFVCQQ